MNNYDYPVERDTSDVPWYQEELPKKEIEVTVSITISKTVKIAVDDYKVEEIIDENGRYLSYDYSDCNLHKAVEEQLVLPQDLAEFTERMFIQDLDLKAAKMPRYLKEAVTDCKDWIVDDMACILE